ncbi:hypothetical protein SAMN05216324_101517 [Chryseobacterium limigenitum]|uniref:Uncharacterized protein n=1 Tax=Chryseobacterium limigenitum TaxID=1612149 RepID=A0A1K2IEI0_9FLAO|nr:hypothetical protein SAMN05216324_101517 [Chryseobacterium limigenitum]
MNRRCKIEVYSYKKSLKGSNKMKKSAYGFVFRNNYVNKFILWKSILLFLKFS